MEDNTGRLIYRCRFCHKTWLVLDNAKKHIPKCLRAFKFKRRDIDFVECSICGFRAKVITAHVKAHIKIETYKKDFGNVICQSSSSLYRASVSGRESYVAQSRRLGLDLTNYWRKVSEGVSKSIIAKPIERERRSKMMFRLNECQNKNPEFIKKISDTAKKTSARPDIIAKRSAQLKKWRDENPEDFYNKCTKKMHNCWQSKPEKILFNVLLGQVGFCFKHGQCVKSDFFDWKSKRKNVDIVDKSARIYIEFDGIYHFEPIRGGDVLKNVQHRDKMLDKHIERHVWTLIRVSDDQFCYKSERFSDECIKALLDIVNQKQRGVFKIGKRYG